VERGRGSAIFLHLAREDGRPTEGCVALAPRDLNAVLAAGLMGVEVVG
jgi:L,D-peptidoglycan transpeptidase YkuD (ErfK/YbiS/YcfS/YnhG family)